MEQYEAELRYRPWGESRNPTGTTPTTYRFTGQREQSEIGLYYYGARWMDPALGRFTSPDCIIPGAGGGVFCARHPANELATERRWNAIPQSGAARFWVGWVEGTISA